MDENLRLLKLLHLGPGALKLSRAARGCFELHSVASADELSAALDRQAFDAVVLTQSEADDLEQLAAWPDLARVAQDSAVLVIARSTPSKLVLRLMQLGVQDVLPQAQDRPVALTRALLLAIERKRLADITRKSISSDLATGLPNQARLMEHLSQLLALREREPAPMVLLALRIEGLAAAEARLGREAASVLRRKVAVRLRSGLRASDVVAALGVDLYGVLLARVEDPDNAQSVIGKLTRSLQRPFSVAGQDVVVAVAIGLAQFPLQGLDADVLLHRALAQLSQGVAIGRSASLPRLGTPAANDE